MGIKTQNGKGLCKHEESHKQTHKKFDEFAILKLKSFLEKYRQNQEIRDKLRKMYLHMKKLLKKIKGTPANKCERAQQLKRKTRWVQNETV